MKTAQILDACCGSRAFWFDRADSRAIFADIRDGTYVSRVGADGQRGRSVSVKPDVAADFRELPFADESFWHVVFDPPHFRRGKMGGNGSTMECYYGMLSADWEEDLRKGFSECFRVLKPHGTLIFKWGEADIPVERVLALTPQLPLYGHRSGRRSLTHWIAFIKGGEI